MTLSRVPCIQTLACAVALFAALGSCAATVRADSLDTAISGLAAEERSKVQQAIVNLGSFEDRTALEVLSALEDRRLRITDDDRVVLADEDGETFRDPVTAESVNVSGELRAPIVTNRMRKALQMSIGRLRLRSEDAAQRLAGAEAVADSPSDELAPFIRSALESERDPRIRRLLSRALAQIDIRAQDYQLRLAAVRTIDELGEIQLKPHLEQLLRRGEDGEYLEPVPQIRQEAGQALTALERKELGIRVLRDLFYGVSLGSVLLLAALGLAITFGLMGVINMAHGEMVMLGAYTTFVVQNLFARHLPQAADLYLLAAVPAAFGVCMSVGVLLERLVIRHLYGRPLETLLATWGISLLLIQTVRLIFGAANVTVANPSWLSGGYELLPGVVLPYTRLAAVVFAGVVVAFIWYLLSRTRLGLQVRAITQNRAMASSMGIAASRVDAVTFGLGSAIAGLGGVALSQLGNVGPELGQLYIVDSFMVVVVGGVGKVAGTVVAALGLGTINKLLEPVSGAVLGKIMVLVLVILFIQRRPQGLFAVKGRAAEA